MGKQHNPPRVYPPGVKYPPSGLYETVGPRGGARPHQEVPHTQGKPLPPTRQPHEGYRLVDPAKHEHKH